MNLILFLGEWMNIVCNRVIKNYTFSEHLARQGGESEQIDTRGRWGMKQCHATNGGRPPCQCGKEGFSRSSGRLSKLR
jgi:hypothetical protein